MIWLSGNLKNFWHSFVLLWGSWVMWFTLLSPFCQMGEKWDVLNQISPLSIYSLLEPIPFPTNSFPYTPSHRIIGSSNWSKKTVSTQLWSPHFPIQSSYQLLLTIAVVPKEWPLDQQHQHQLGCTVLGPPQTHWVRNSAEGTRKLSFNKPSSWFWYPSDKHWTPALSILWSLLSEGHPVMAPRPTVQPLVCVCAPVHTLYSVTEKRPFIFMPSCLYSGGSFAWNVLPCLTLYLPTWCFI